MEKVKKLNFKKKTKKCKQITLRETFGEKIVGSWIFLRYQLFRHRAELLVAVGHAPNKS